MNSIIWKGIPSTDIQGLLICELPPITKPEMRTRETEIDGKDGSIIEELGYAPYTKTMKIGLHSIYNIDKVIKYFTGEGDVIFSNEPDRVYHARITEQIDFTRLLRYRQATVKFTVQPYKYKRNEYMVETQTATASGTNLVLKDSGNTLMKITTDAIGVTVHGKNLVDAYNLDISTNKSVDVFDGGYKIVVVGGTTATYTGARYYLPLQTRGKTYTLKLDGIVSEATSGVCVQVKVKTDSETGYYTLNPNETKKSMDFTVPEDATSIGVSIYTNNSNTILSTDNTVTVLGLRVVPVEFKNDEWCEFKGSQTIGVVDGVVNVVGYEPVTVISNATNAEMVVEYFKSFEIFNEGYEESKPLMVLKGNGTVAVSVNGQYTFAYTFPEGENEVYIDSEAEDAYLGNTLKNRNMNGDFPVLIPATNKITWSGDVESIAILPRSRWL